MRPFLDFDDPGADDDHPARGVTCGDIRAWHDEFERICDAIAAIQRAAKENRVCDYVAWFDHATTLHDYCAQALKPVAIYIQQRAGEKT